MNTMGFLDIVLRDFRHAFRALRCNPGFAMTALLTLAIGIGANIAVFSVVNSVLLNPLPYPNPEDLVAVWHKAPGRPGLESVNGDLRLSGSMFFTYADENRSFENIGIWFDGSSTVTGVAEPEQVRTIVVSDGTLQALRIQPLLGRWLLQADQKPGGPATAIISYGYWQRRFGAEKSAIGRSITVDDIPREIVGVMPRGFRVADVDLDIILPLSLDRSRQLLFPFGFRCVARLKPNVTISQANADISRMLPIWMKGWPMLAGADPRMYEAWKIAPSVRSLKEDVIGDTGNTLWVLMETIGIVMLIACVNVANLLLVRTQARERELAVRAALGAGWGRIVQELLSESFLLGFLGGSLGLLVAYAGLRVLVEMGPASLPRLTEISIDSHVLAFSFIVSVFAGLLFGLIPALKYAGPRISRSLRVGGRTFSEGRERQRLRNVLVVAQLSLALVLLVCSGLMIRSVQMLRSIDPGFSHPEQLQLMRISIPGLLVPEPKRVARLQNDILDKLAAIPGVKSVGLSNSMPLEGRGGYDAIRIEGRAYSNNEYPASRLIKFVSPGFFQTAGTRFIAGRDYTWDDLYDGRPFIIVSENLAREVWQTPLNAIGKRIGTNTDAPVWREVIGVVQDVHDSSLKEPAPKIVYWPSFGQGFYIAGQPMYVRTATFVVRSPQAGMQGLLKQMQQAVWSVNSNLAIASTQTEAAVYDRSLAQTSFTLVMLSIAGAMALLLGIIGIYGVIAYAVSQRKREMAIRLALGAQPRELKQMFLWNGLKLTAVGVTIGMVASSLISRVMSSLLFGVTSMDPLTYGSVPLILLTVALCASYVPARRAALVDPIEALRAE